MMNQNICYTKLSAVILLILGFIFVLILASCSPSTSTTDSKTVSSASIVPSPTGSVTGNVVKEPQTIKIGASLPLTGDAAFIGIGAKNALELALHDIQGTKYQYKLIFEDDKLDPKTTSTVATKLMEVNNVDAIISFSSGTGNVVTPLAESHKVIHFGVASDPNVAKGIYNFIHWTSPDEEARKWVEEANKRGFKRIAIIGVQQQGMFAVVESIKTFVKNTSMKIVDVETFPFGEKDFRTMILKTQEQKPDLYALMAFDPELPVLYKQMQELKIDVPVSGIESFELTANPALFEGKWFVTGADASSEFNTEYRTLYNKEPSLGAPNAYDIVGLIVSAYEKTSTDPTVKPSQEAVVATLQNLKGYDGALGKLTVGNDGIVWSGASTRVIKNGKPVSVG